MEFLGLLALAICAMTALVVVSVVNVSDASITEVLKGAFTMLVGALVALAYAARGQQPPKAGT